MKKSHHTLTVVCYSISFVRRVDDIGIRNMINKFLASLSRTHVAYAISTHIGILMKNGLAIGQTRKGCFEPVGVHKIII